MIRNRKLIKAVALYLLIQFSLQTFLPSIALALTSGPSQPEFSSFEPVSSSQMVDEFSGDFTYNLPIIEVPGPHGSSYPLSLSYHSGVTPEEESSWVGYGWTLNPGAINRNTRGVPDDYNGNVVKFHNKRPKNWTATVGGGAQFGESFAFDTKVGVNGTLRYNNYRGFGFAKGVGIHLAKGLISLGYHADNGEGSFSLNVNPAAILNYGSNPSTVVAGEIGSVIDKFMKKDMKVLERYLTGGGKSSLSNGGINLVGGTYGIFSYNESTKPNIIQKYTGASYNLTVGFEANALPIPLGGTVNLSGSYSWQKNDPVESVPAYGYLYSANSSASSVMDYHVEKETDFNKRDVFLGIPFNDADNFIVTGEGLGGGFRVYNNSNGHFGPRNVNNELSIFNVGAEVAGGWTFGPGLDIGVGSHKFSVEDWDRASSFKSFREQNTDEPVVFRFNNDLGGEWGVNHNDQAVQASITSRNFSLPYNDFTLANNNERTGRSSYIGFHTNDEIVTQNYLAYSKNSIVNTQAQRNDPDKRDLIGELGVTNISGARYLYGLPVYNRNEKSLSFGVERASPANIEKNYFIYNTKDDKTKIGQEQDAPYASTYLLTEITGSDYVDRSNNGTTQDDFGGYTRFNYKKETGGDGWYKWRAPFRGLFYNKNSHSDAKDDLGSYSEGEREVYYLKTIETKTHVAVFELLPRQDAKEAPNETTALSPSAAPGNFALFKLDNIKLYPIEECLKNQTTGLIERDETGSPRLKNNAKPIKTVYFVYDYSLCTGLPNSSNGGGKLTLKSIYFEYNGLNKTKISPYQFKYEYPDYTKYPSKYRSGIDNVTENYGPLSLSSSIQKPSYSEFNSDPWGNFWTDGQNRFDAMQTWIDQTKEPNIDFDPAAWNLKVIQLPSGGEIHVQYEQDDYSFVQNQEAHVMVKLHTSSILGVGPRFYIEPSSINVSGANVTVLSNMIHDRYVNTGRKIYFKFLYQLMASSQAFDLRSCNAEFITGYATVTACGVDNGKVYIDLKNDERLPKAVCEEFLQSQRLGMLDPNSICDPSIGMSDSNSPQSVVRQLATMIGKPMLPDQLICPQLSPENSYLRVPTPLAKKGGGLRVKRLLMFSEGLESESVLYGNEYIYETEVDNRTISSGVATNEPSTIREENILTDFVARKGQSNNSRIVAGKDKTQSEGPIGESILPGPSVGYSKVVIRSIHSGNTTPGYSISEYFTAKDYPILTGDPNEASSMTSLKSIPIQKVFNPGILVNVINDKTVASQGFNFILNSMHGQIKQTTAYRGAYTSSISIDDKDKVAYTKYTYFNPGEKVPMMSSINAGVIYKNPGREVDMTLAQRSVIEKSYDVNVEGDFQMTIIPLLFVVIVIPYPMAVPSFTKIEGEFSTHAISKVIRYPAIVKSVEVYQDGITHTEENVAFDEWTGQPVAVKSQDEFKGAYLAQNIPASWEYQTMAGKWKTEGKRVTGNFSFNGEYVTLSDGCNLTMFTPGDKIEVKNELAGSGAIYHVTALDPINNRLRIIPSMGGVSAPTSPTVITIIQSGRTNQLAQQAGNITLFSEQKENLAIPLVNQVNRYETNNFVADLTAATIVNSSFGNFTLTGIYNNMDMSAFSEKITSCSIDLTNATITQVQYRYRIEASGLVIELMSFKIDCGEGINNGITIAAEGWDE